jgi:nitroreductase
MANPSIFKDPLQTGYREPVPPMNTDAFRAVVETRRSVRVYTEDPVPEEVMRECLKLSLLAPNSSNLQPWEFFWVRTPEKKQKLVEYCLSQPAARTAAELVVAVARPDYWKPNHQRMMKIFEEQGKLNTKAAYWYYKKIVPLAYTQGFLSLLGLGKRIFLFFRAMGQPLPRGPVSHADMKLWAQKSTALACENLMLALRAYDFDSCPMEGMDPVRIKKLLNLPARAGICMVISAGKRAENGVYGKRIRFDESLFLHEV